MDSLGPLELRREQQLYRSLAWVKGSGKKIEAEDVVLLSMDLDQLDCMCLGRQERGAVLETSEHLFAHFVPATGMVKAVEVVVIVAIAAAMAMAMVIVTSIATSLVSTIVEVEAVVMLFEGQMVQPKQVTNVLNFISMALAISISKEQVREQVKVQELELESSVDLVEVLAIMEQSTIILGPDITSLREHVELQQVSFMATILKVLVLVIIVQPVEAVEKDFCPHRHHFRQIWDDTEEYGVLSHISIDVDSKHEGFEGDGSLKAAQILLVHMALYRASCLKPSQGYFQCASQEKAPAQPELRSIASKL